MLPGQHLNYKYFVIGGWSKISIQDDNENITATLPPTIKIVFTTFINCYLALSIIIMIMITYRFNQSCKFKTIRDLHKTCTAKILDTTETQRVIDSFTNQFYHLFMEYNLSMTLKVHIIIHHYQYFFEKSGKTMKMTNGEFVETCHYSLKQSEDIHGLKVKKKLGTPMHMQKSWQSIVLYNSKRAGHVTPLRLKKKSSSSRTPKTSPPFSGRFLEKYPNVLELHNILNKKL